MLKKLYLPLLLICLSISCHAENKALRPTVSDLGSSEISISLAPGTAVYASEDVRYGAVHFTASLKNQSKSQIIIAHPSVCVPSDYQSGSTLHFTDHHSRSEILLSVTKPDGETEILRDGYFHGFDPDGLRYLTIPPGTSKEFSLGWFFPNARGRWEDDVRAADLFLDKGRYTVKLLYRNFFPKSVIFDELSKDIRLFDVWTGEILSNDGIVEIK